MTNRTWTALTDGFWDVATNWDGNTIPQPLDDVTIDVASDVTVTHRTGNSSVNSLLLEDAFVLSSGTLTANTIDVNSTFTLGGGTLVGAIVDVSGGSLLFTNSTNNRLDGVTVLGDINLDAIHERVRLQNGTTFSGNANLTGRSTILSIEDTQTLDNLTINLNGTSATLNVGSSNTLTLGSNAQVNLNSDESRIRSDLFVSGNGTVINQGTITADGAGSTASTDDRHISPDNFTNAGTINVINDAQLYLTATTWTNTATGQINATDSDVIFQDDWDNNGVVTLNNSRLELEGTFTTDDIGTINQTNNSSVFIEGVLDNTGDTLTFDSSRGSYILNGGFIQGGTIEQNDGEQLLFGNSTNSRLNAVTLQGDLTIDTGISGTVLLQNSSAVQGNLNLVGNGSDVRIQTGSTFTGNVTLTGVGTVLSVEDTRTLDNLTINLDGALSNLVVGGNNTLTLGSNAQVNLNGDDARIRSDFFVSGNGAVINQGTITADGIGSSSSTDDSHISSDSFTNEGTINVINDAQFFLDSAVWTNAATGQINATNSELIFRDDWDNDGVVNLDNSRLDLEGTFTTDDIGTINKTNGSSVFIEGTLDNTGDTLTFDGTRGSYILNGGIIQGGTIEQNDGERLKFGSSTNSRLDGVTLQDNLTIADSNTGRVLLQNGTIIQGDINLTGNNPDVRVQSGSTFTGDANLTGSGTVLSIEDTQTLDNLTINLDGVFSSLVADGTNTLTLGSNAQINLKGDEARIRSDFFVSGNGSVINQGIITVDGTGSTSNTDERYISSDSFTNEGTINVINDAQFFLDSAVWTNAATGQISATNSELIFRDDWDNDGVVNLDNSRLDLEGTFTTDDIGTINKTNGSSVFIEGTLDNTGDTLTFDSTRGSYILNGGIIQGGTIEQNDGERLLFGSSTNSRLDGVTLQGNLTMADSNTGRVLLQNGTIIQGDINLTGNNPDVRVQSGSTFTGDANLSGSGTALSIEDTQTLDNLTLNLDGAFSALVVSGTNTLTLGSNAQVNLNGDDARIRSDFFVNGDGGIINQGTITADGVGSSSRTDDSHIDPDSFTNEGIVESINDAEFRVSNLTNMAGTTLTGGTYKVGDNSILRLEDADIVNNAANIELDGANSDLFGNLSGTNVDALANFANNTAGGRFTIRNGRNLTTPGNFTNAGAVTIGDSSTFMVTGNYSQTDGSTSFEGGTLTATGGSADFQDGSFTGFGTINADVTNSGEYIADADADILNINGDYTQATDGVLNIELGGTSAGEFDQFNITGTANLGGTLNITILDGSMLQAGDEFTVLTFANALGRFDTINTTTVNGLAVRTEFNADHLRVFVNTPPVANDDTPTTDEESSVEVTVLNNDTDIDGDSPVITAIDTTDVDGAVTFTDSTITYDPNGQLEFLAVGETATETFEYTIEDNFGGSDTATVTVTIDGVNDSPIAEDDIRATDEDNALVITPLTNDSDVDTSDVLSIQSVDTTGVTGDVTFTNTTISYAPNGQFESLAEGETATETFSYTVSDGNGGTATATVTITIDGVNDAPVLNNIVLDQTATEDEAFSFTVPSNTFSDIDTNDNLIYSATLDDDSPLPSWLSFDDNSQTFSGTPPTNALGALSLKLTATDTANAAVSDVFVLTVDGQSSSSNIIEGTEGRDRLTGTETRDGIFGFGGNDILDGLAGNDELDGGAGNDRIIGGSGDDDIDGGTGKDWIDYRNSLAGLTVNLTTGTGTGGDAEGDTLANIERIHGSNFDDELTGDAQRNVLIGYDGADTLNGEAENDNLQGRDGTDILNGGDGNDRLQGDAGADVLDGGAGLDWATYRLSEIGINVNLASGLASGGHAEGDTLTNIERLQGSQFNDQLVGDDSRNVLVGLKGDDSISGGAGQDSLNGQQGADTLTGGSDRDAFAFKFGDSFLSGYDQITDLEIGNDRINGPNKVAAADVAQLGSVSSLTETDIQAVLTTTTFESNGAATFSVGSQTFVVLNDIVAGFDSDSDLIIEITGFNGSLNNLSIV